MIFDKFFNFIFLVVLSAVSVGRKAVFFAVLRCLRNITLNIVDFGFLKNNAFFVPHGFQADSAGAISPSDKSKYSDLFSAPSS